MADAAAPIVPGPDWDRLPARLAGATAMVIGQPGLGKTCLVRYLIHRLGALGRRVGLLTTDMGQTALGVPACLALSRTPPWGRAERLWFIGDTSPVGNLLPTVVGAARLAHEARDAGTESLVVDTTGLALGPLGRVLKYHKAVALGVSQVVAIQQAGELEPLLGLLEGLGAAVHRLAPAPAARSRSAVERKQHREASFRKHLEGGRVCELPADRLIGPDWTINPMSQGQAPAPGTLAGLLDGQGFCLGLGLLETARPGGVEVYTALPDAAQVARLQTGRLRLSRVGEELR